LILVVLISALNGNVKVDSYGQNIRFAQFYTPAIAIFSLVTACDTSLLMGIYLGSWVAGAIAVGISGVLLLFAVAVPAFHVHIYASQLPMAFATLLLGSLCLASLGVAVAS